MDLLSLGKEPISKDQPTGSDVRYEPEFESLQAEIDKLSSPSAVDRTDWKVVSDFSKDILSEKSKDILVACYFAVSQIHMNQVDGLADGLTTIHDMVTLYWDSMFPPKKRMRGRLGAIEFWIEKTESALEGIAQSTANSRWDEINTAFANLDSFLKEALPEPPLLTPIERQIQRLFQQAGSPGEAQGQAEEEPSPKEVPAAPESSAGKPSPPEPVVKAAPAGGAVSSNQQFTDPGTEIAKKDAKKTVQKGFQDIRQAASLIFDDQHNDAAAYRYRRIAAWGNVFALPPVNGDKTQIPPPPPHELQNILDLRENKSWEFLLRSAEHKVSQFIFWFDLNRFVAEALINLGEEFISAHKVVCDETAFLLHRLKGLDRLAFSDGTPFADPKTRQWIKSIAPAGGGSPAEQMPAIDQGQGADIAEQMADTIKKARDLVSKMKIAEAVGLVHSELQQCRSQKESLLWRMSLCRIILGSNKKEMALPHIELIVDDIDTYQLESWDPGLALSALMVAWTGYSSVTENQPKNKAAEILNRIAKIDPVQAMRIGK